MKKKGIRKCISMLLILCMVLTFVPMSYAADYTPYGNSSTITMDRITYYDPFGTGARDTDDMTKLLQDVVSMQSPSGYSLFHYWHTIAGTAALSSDSFTGGLDDILGHSIVAKVSVTNPNAPITTYSGIWEKSNSTMATSLANAGNKIREDFKSYLNRPHSSIDVVANPWANETIQEPVIYQTYQFKYNEGNIQGANLENHQIAGYAIAFYDFEFIYLENGKELASPIQGSTTITEAAQKAPVGFSFTTNANNPTYITGVRNESQTPISATQTIGKNTRLEVTNSYNISSQNTVTKTTNETTRLGAKIPLLENAVEFSGEKTASNTITSVDVFTNDSGNITTNERVTSQESGLGVSLPPHTEAVLEQRNDFKNLEISYDYPIGIAYKVRVMSYGKLASLNAVGASQVATYKMEDVAQFGREYEEKLHGYAFDNLNLRYANRSVAGYETSHGDDLDWNAVFDYPEDKTIANNSAAFAPGVAGFDNKRLFWHHGYSYPFQYTTSDLDSAVNAIYKYRPMSVIGAKMKISTESINSIMRNVNPIYPLSTITTKNTYEYDMNAGDKLFVDNITLNGLNNKGVEYYGFHERNGRWELLDENGNPTNGGDVAEIYKDPVSEAPQLNAKGEGTVYLQYVIDEDAYYTIQNGQQVYTTNGGLSKTAKIKVNVSDKPFDGKVVALGTATAAALDAPINLDDCDTLKAFVYNNKEKEISRPVVWEAQNLTKHGIEIENNQLKFTKPGSFKIRATSGGKESNWVTVTSVAPRELNSIRISDNVSPAALQGDVSNGAISIDLSQLTVKSYDQYNDDWANAFNNPTWVCEGSGASINGNTLDITSAGGFKVYLKSDNISSNKLEFTIKDSSKTSGNNPGGNNPGGNNPGGNNPGGITSPTDVDASINPTKAAFDKNPGSLTFLDVKTKLDAGSHKLDSIHYGNKKLTLDKDYSVDGNTYTINKEYLATLDAGLHIFRFDMDSGADPTLVVTVSNSSGTWSNPFIDVKDGHWFFNGVKYSHMNALMSGVSEDIFAPNSPLSRGMIATILWRNEGSPAPSAAAKYTDLKQDWYRDAVAWASENGIMKGYNSKTFGPHNSLTREQMATIFFNYSKFKGNDVSARASLNKFTDANKVSSWAQDGMQWAVAEKLITGTDKGLLDPKGKITRAQSATILHRFLDN